MQTEERSTCPSCGGDNPKTAAFCWRCYASMAPTSGPGGPAGVVGDPARSFGRPGMPMPSPPSIPAPPVVTNAPSTFVRVAVVAAASLIAVFGVRSVLDRGPSLPDTLAGSPRMTTQDAKNFEKQMIEEGKNSDLDVVSGVYGAGAAPSFIVLLVEGKSAEATDDIFSEFVSGMASGGATVDEAATQSGQHAGVEYRCVPVVAPQVEAGACMWRDDHTLGIVFGLAGGIDATKDLLFRVYDELA